MIKLQKGTSTLIILPRNHYAIRGWEYRVNGLKLGYIYKRMALGVFTGSGIEEGETIYTIQSDINILPPEHVQAIKLGIKNAYGAHIAWFKTRKDAQKALRKYLEFQMQKISEETRPSYDESQVRNGW